MRCCLLRCRGSDIQRWIRRGNKSMGCSTTVSSVLSHQSPRHDYFSSSISGRHNPPFKLNGQYSQIMEYSTLCTNESAYSINRRRTAQFREEPSPRDVERRWPTDWSWLRGSNGRHLGSIIRKNRVEITRSHRKCKRCFVFSYRTHHRQRIDRQKGHSRRTHLKNFPR